MLGFGPEFQRITSLKAQIDVLELPIFWVQHLTAFQPIHNLHKFGFTIILSSIKEVDSQIPSSFNTLISELLCLAGVWVNPGSVWDDRYLYTCGS